MSAFRPDTHPRFGAGSTDGARWRFTPGSAELAGRLVAALGRTPFAVFNGKRGAGPDADIAVDVSALDGLSAIDTDSGVVHASSGVEWAELERRLRRRGHTLGPIPRWLDGLTIAETLAERRMWRPSPRYGELADALLGLRAALAQGLSARAVAPRRATGPDLARLPVGAGHRAGLVTDVHLRIWPQPREQAHRIYIFRGWNDARAAAVAALRAGVHPAWWCLRRQKRKVALVAGLDGPGLEGLMARFDEAMGEGKRGDDAEAVAFAAERIDLADDPADAAADLTPVRPWAGADLAAGARGLTKAEVWDLRPEGATFAVARAAVGPTRDAGWSAMAEAVFAALNDEGAR